MVYIKMHKHIQSVTFLQRIFQHSSCINRATKQKLLMFTETDILYVNTDS